MSSAESGQESEGEWTGPKFVKIHGVRAPIWQSIHPDTAKDLLRFPTRAEDVFIVTYPKSGAEQENGFAVLENLRSPRLLASHLPHNLILRDDSESPGCAKYIYVARNPKDVVVSYYHHVKGFPEEESGFRGPFEFFTRLFLQGKLLYCPWADHVLGWWKRRDQRNVLFLKYEDMKKDIESNVRKIADFLGKPICEAVVKKISKQCTFGEMAKNESVYKLYDSSSGPTLVRKGAVGDWKNHFSAEMDARFETDLVNKLKSAGLAFSFT